MPSRIFTSVTTWIDFHLLNIVRVWRDTTSRARPQQPLLGVQARSQHTIRQQNARLQQLAVGSVLAFFVLALLYFDSGTARHRSPGYAVRVGPAAAEERLPLQQIVLVPQPNANDELAECRALSRLRVCSHRASLGPSDKGNDVPFLERMTALATAGVPCYDIDMVATADGRLVVGHPAHITSELRAAGRTVQAGLLDAVPWSDYVAAGLDKRHPLLEDVLAAFSRIVAEAEGGAVQAGEGGKGEAGAGVTGGAVGAVDGSQQQRSGQLDAAQGSSDTDAGDKQQQEEVKQRQEQQQKQQPQQQQQQADADAEKKNTQEHHQAEQLLSPPPPQKTEQQEQQPQQQNEQQGQKSGTQPAADSAASTQPAGRQQQQQQQPQEQQQEQQQQKAEGQQGEKSEGRRLLHLPVKLRLRRQQQQPQQQPAVGGSSDPVPSKARLGPMLFIELKERAMRPATAEAIRNASAAFGVESRVALWLPRLGGGVAEAVGDHLRRSGSTLIKILGLPDSRRLPNGTLALSTVQLMRDDAARYDMFGPSVKLPDALWREVATAASSAGRPLVAWVVDGMEDAIRVARSGGDAVIVNDPLRLIERLRQATRGCQGGGLGNVTVAGAGTGAEARKDDSN